MRKKGVAAIVAAAAVIGTAVPAQAAFYDVINLRGVEIEGEDFAAHLAREYRAQAFYEADEMYDWIDAEHFANKATAAKDGMVPQPEQPGDWSIGEADAMAELTEARAALVEVLEPGAAIDPATAAVAQVRYDCWVEQQEEGWQTDHINACKGQFYAALEKLQAALAQPAEPALPPEVTVFFDFDSAVVSDGARDTLKRMVDALKQNDRQVVVNVVGHADRAGSSAYNMRLSQARAEAVRDALRRLGLSAKAFEVTAKGEGDPLVPTQDGVREPRNRRVSISVE